MMGIIGSISPLGVTPVNDGSSQTFTITPDSGYTVGTLTIDSSPVATSTTHTFTNVTSNRTIAVTFVDNTSPTVSVTVPTTGTTVHGSGVTLTATSADNVAVAGVQFKLDTNTLIGAEGVTSPYSVTWDTTSGVADGGHTIIAVARDAAGNYATSTAITVTVDNTAPVRSVGAPSGTLALNTTSAILSLITNETATCKYSTSLGITYGSMTTFTNTASTTHSTSISGLTNGGNYNYYVKCQDNYTNTNSSDYTISFSVASDITAPSVTMTAPATGTTVHGSTVTLTATSTDDVAVVGVQFKLDNATNIGAEGATSPYSITWDTTTGVSDGPHSIVAVARDGSNNYATSTATNITVDNTAPTRSLGSPTGALSFGTTATTLSLSTNENATCKYSTSSGTAYGSMSAFDTTGTTTHSTSISGLTNNTSYTYYVRCQDNYTNTNLTDYDISFSVAGDTTSPTVSLTAPADTSTVSGSSVTISANASDNAAVAGVQFKLDTNTLIGSEVTTPPYNIIWDSTGVADGSHTLIAVARDNSNNYATSTAVNITVSNTVVPATPPIVTISHSSSGQYSRSFFPPVQPLTVSQSSPTFTYNLSPKSTSSDVKLLQIYLNTHGFVIAKTGAGSPNHETNYFGLATKAALIKFQKANNILPATGDFGPRTRALFNVINTNDTSSTPTSASVSPTTPSASSFTQDLEKGMTGDDVKLLQIYLNTHGFPVASSGPGSPKHENTLFGPATKAALIKFQKAKGITPTVGYFGPVTRKYINVH